MESSKTFGNVWVLRQLMMKILGIDSSTPQSNVALLLNQKDLYKINSSDNTKGSRTVLNMIDSVLTQAKLSIQEIDCFTVTTGPGSFTGLRVGISLIKGFVLVTKKPFIGISTLKAIANLIKPCSQPICSILDARKQQLYAGLYQHKNKEPKALRPESAIYPEELNDWIKEPTYFIGSGLKSYKEQLKSLLGENFLDAPMLNDWNIASSAIHLARENIDTEKNYNLNSLKISYLRKSEAEINLNPLATKGD